MIRVPDGVPIVDARDVPAVIESMVAADSLMAALDRHRPHTGQPHTAQGVRGQRALAGITTRDVHDAFIIGAYLASGLPRERYPQTVYDLPWEQIDPVAVIQNASIVLERRAGLGPHPQLETTVPGQDESRTTSPADCIFCDNEWPDLCPPHLHALGNQAPRYAAGDRGPWAHVTVTTAALPEPAEVTIRGGEYVVVAADPAKVLHQAVVGSSAGEPLSVIVIQGLPAGAEEDGAVPEDPDDER